MRKIRAAPFGQVVRAAGCKPSFDCPGQTGWKVIFPAASLRANARELVELHVCEFRYAVSLGTLGRAPVELHPFRYKLLQSSVPHGAIVIRQTVKADVVFAGEQVFVARHVLEEFAQRDYAAAAIVHQPTDREDLRCDMPFE